MLTSKEFDPIAHSKGMGCAADLHKRFLEQVKLARESPMPKEQRRKVKGHKDIDWVSYYLGLEDGFRKATADLEQMVVQHEK